MTKGYWSIGKIILYAILIAIGVIWVYPFVWMISASLKSNNEVIAGGLKLIPESPTFENYLRTWNQADFKVYFFNSIVVTVSVVVLTLFMTATAGYVLGRYDFWGKKVLFSVFIASIMIPMVSTIIPVFEIIKGMGLLGTRTGLILAQAGGTHVVFLMLFAGYFRQIPKELEEAAEMDGCNFFRLFGAIMFPLAKPMSITVIIMESIWAWNAFMLPLVLTLNNPSARTLAVGLYAFKGENIIDWSAIAAGGVIAVMPVVILFIFTQRYFVDGVAGAVKS